jgi:hypothetical protein
MLSNDDLDLLSAIDRCPQFAAYKAALAAIQEDVPTADAIDRLDAAVVALACAAWEIGRRQAAAAEQN